MDLEKDCQNQDRGPVVLRVHSFGNPSVEVEVPGDATGEDAARLVSQKMGIHFNTWPGLHLVTISGEKIPLESKISPWHDQGVRLGITHSSVRTGRSEKLKGKPK